MILFEKYLHSLLYIICSDNYEHMGRIDKDNFLLLFPVPSPDLNISETLSVFS